MNGILDFGIKLILALQGLGAWLVVPMKFFSFLGTEQFFLVVLPALYWCVSASVGLQVGIILLVNGAVNDAFKLALHGPRPYWYSPLVEPYATETSFGVPSGHAQIATGVWGVMAAGLKKGWAWLAAGIVIFLIGLSRLYLAVHFPHDVLLGWIIGGLLLWLLLRFWGPATARVKKLTFGGQVLAAFLASLILVLIELVPFLWLKLTGWQLPQAWAQYAGEAVTLSGAFTSAGVLFGLLAGLAWMDRLGGFSSGGPVWKRILRYLLGLVGVLVFYIGLSLLFGLIAPDSEAVLPYLLRYVRYALVGAWLSLGAPWVFMRLGLAEKAA
jgi:membrane-associated phospholipid phosphatase